jgi:hypothetical protein
MNHDKIRENVKISAIILVALSTMTVGVLVHLGSLELVSSINNVQEEIGDLKQSLGSQLKGIRNDVQQLQAIVTLLLNTSSSLIPLP